jgi:hypothetical protein
VLLANVSELSVGSIFIHLPVKMELIESSETSANNTQMLGTYPKESKLHLKHGENLKSRKLLYICIFFVEEPEIGCMNTLILVISKLYFITVQC